MMKAFSQKYKKNFSSGWFKESYRHSLASKGIKTRKFMGTPQSSRSRANLERANRIMKRSLIDEVKGKIIGTRNVLQNQRLSERNTLKSELEFWEDVKKKLSDDPNFDIEATDKKIKDIKDKISRKKG